MDSFMAVKGKMFYTPATISKTTFPSVHEDKSVRMPHVPSLQSIPSMEPHVLSVQSIPSIERSMPSLTRSGSTPNLQRTWSTVPTLPGQVHPTANGASPETRPGPRQQTSWLKSTFSFGKEGGQTALEAVASSRTMSTDNRAARKLKHLGEVQVSGELISKVLLIDYSVIIIVIVISMIMIMIMIMIINNVIIVNIVIIMVSARTSSKIIKHV
jgi:hypothetical protein